MTRRQSSREQKDARGVTGYLEVPTAPSHGISFERNSPSVRAGGGLCSPFDGQVSVQPHIEGLSGKAVDGNAMVQTGKAQPMHRPQVPCVSSHCRLSPGNTGHAEVVRVVYQPERISFEELLKVFWENHDPTQGLRQGNDHGSQYRSAIYPTSTAHMEAALRSKEDYQKSPPSARETVTVIAVIFQSTKGWKGQQMALSDRWPVWRCFDGVLRCRPLGFMGEAGVKSASGVFHVTPCQPNVRPPWKSVLNYHFHSSAVAAAATGLVTLGSLRIEVAMRG
ncbi:hypothetical protein CB1_000336005 [Camelus ferus]|nr:hypothetical protein CB1_000336005 [Camelus ferus]